MQTIMRQDWLKCLLVFHVDSFQKRLITAFEARCISLFSDTSSCEMKLPGHFISLCLSTHTEKEAWIMFHKCTFNNQSNRFALGYNHAIEVPIVLQLFTFFLYMLLYQYWATSDINMHLYIRKNQCKATHITPDHCLSTRPVTQIFCS